MSIATVTDPLSSTVLSAWVGTDTVAVPDDPIVTCLAPRSPDAT